jgi:hypothetical protein
MCKLFEQKLVEKNERLSRKFYQLFKEQTSINYDDVTKQNHFFFYPIKKLLFYLEITRKNSNIFFKFK